MSCGGMAMARATRRMAPNAPLQLLEDIRGELIERHKKMAATSHEVNRILIKWQENMSVLDKESHEAVDLELATLLERWETYLASWQVDLDRLTDEVVLNLMKAGGVSQHMANKVHKQTMGSWRRSFPRWAAALQTMKCVVEAVKISSRR
ncbi:hypothetical protein BDV95DRAFT_154745 [Massariosphaeria phaeospora]|uniref:Uncharacterized protein n=1 Tax=Massariosphaeria phaeospora TaxID=100035 RepID=A0A7C8IEJ7_9PLEO|nr:hypothetical protein BDV95DRAFT_154745 [Massariosphaeria phaeospora]